MWPLEVVELRQLCTLGKVECDRIGELEEFSCQRNLFLGGEGFEGVAGCFRRKAICGCCLLLLFLG